MSSIGSTGTADGCAGEARHSLRAASQAKPQQTDAPAEPARPDGGTASGASAEQRERPVAAAIAAEGEQQHALVRAEAELPVIERHLLGAWAEQHLHEPLALGVVQRDQALEQAFEVLEETGLALVDPDH